MNVLETVGRTISMEVQELANEQEEHDGKFDCWIVKVIAFDNELPQLA